MKLDFELKNWIYWFQTAASKNYPLAVVAFFFSYLFIAAINVPGTGALNLSAGVIFGFFEGLVIVSFASAIGATLSLMLARTVLRAWVQRRFARFSARVNRGIDKSGASYLFTLRMIPVVPYFVINPAFGLTQMSVLKFYIVSQLGMLPLATIYVNLGASVGNLQDITFWGVFTPQLIAALLLLLILPLATKFAIARFSRNAEPSE